ncbi:MAG: BspA family leucine-rich repeat surface protein [Niabella sp.]
MKQLFLLLGMLLSFGAGAQNNPFVTKWKFDAQANVIRFYAQTADGAVNYTWSASPSGNSGSGNFTQAAAGLVTLSGLSIAAGDAVTLSMEPINLRRFYISDNQTDGPDSDKLTDVAAWGDVPWNNMQWAFTRAPNLQNITATDVPNLAGVTNMSAMFRNSANLEKVNKMNTWDVSKVTNMGDMFLGAAKFNENISTWDVSSVTTMSAMFQEARAFNQNIGGWNVSKVTAMQSMFYRANVFNWNLSSWNVSNVLTAHQMFREAFAFNQNISGWDVSKMTRMADMFRDARAFDQNLGAWKLNSVSHADGARRMFYISDPTLGMSCENYSLTLQGWANNNDIASNVNFTEQNGRKYSSLVVDARNALIAKGWSFSGDGLVEEGSPCYNMTEPEPEPPLPPGAVIATFNNGYLLVRWSTATETNNSHFEIEASTNDENFTKIGRVESKAENGHSSEQLNYDFSIRLNNIYPILAAGIGIFLLGSAGIGIRRRKKYLSVLLMVAGIGLVIAGCTKKDISPPPVESEEEEIEVIENLHIRIKQVNKDGGFEYSEVVKAEKGE